MRLSLMTVCISVFATSSFAEDFAGCYAGNKGGPMMIKISQAGGRYVGAPCGRGKCAESIEIRKASADELEKVFRKDASQIQAGLIAEKAKFGIFKAKPSASIERKHKDSDYFALMPFGGGGVYKIRCE